MKSNDIDFEVQRLSECRITSPISNIRFVGDNEQVLYHSNLEEIEGILESGKRPPVFEKAGPREKIYFDPSKLKCGIVTCGGLCPGLNDVIRAIVLALYHHYGVRTIFGFPYGYEGLSHKYGHAPLELTPSIVEDIHQNGRGGITCLFLLQRGYQCRIQVLSGIYRSPHRVGSKRGNVPGGELGGGAEQAFPIV